jgi:hypothetical protein
MEMEWKRWVDENDCFSMENDYKNLVLKWKMNELKVK